MNIKDLTKTQELKETILKHRGVLHAEILNSGEGEIVVGIVPNATNGSIINHICALDEQISDKELELVEFENKLSIIAHNSREAEFLYNEIIVLNEYLKNGIHLKESPIVIDIGANIGMFSILTSKIQSDAKIISIEPIKELCEVIRLNGILHDANIEVLNIAIGEEDGETKFTYYNSNSVMSSMYANAEDQSVLKSYLTTHENVQDEAILDKIVSNRLEGEERICTLKTLGSIFTEKNITHVDLLKIDVEKAELEVLNGIHESQWAYIQQIVIEVHDQNNRLNIISDLLKEKGFSIKTDFNINMSQTKMITLYASKSPAASRDQIYIPDPLKWQTKKSLEQSINQFLIDENLPKPTAYLFTDIATYKQNKNSLYDLYNNSVKNNAPMEGKKEDSISRRLKNIWSNLLNLETTDIRDDDDFFELGGNSLKAVSLIVEVEKEFGEDALPPEKLFDSSTFSSIRQILAASEK